MRLLFVYNADSSIFDQVKDAFHKSVFPNSYQCNLCGLTYGAVSMNNEWKEFIKKLAIKSDFLHKDEFRKNYPQLGSIELPAVFLISDITPKEIITAQEINQQKTLENLKDLVLQKVNSLI